MKLLVATHRAYPILGGLEQHVYNVSKLASKKSSDLKILNLAFARKARAETIHNNFTVETIKSAFILGDSYPLSMLGMIGYYRAIKRFNPSLIHTHGRYFTSTVVAYLYSRFNSIPLVHTEHIEGKVYFENALLSTTVSIIDSVWSRILYSHAKVITAVSQSAQKYIQTTFGKEGSLVSNFINPETLEQAHEIQLPKELQQVLSQTKKNVLFPYRLLPSKGYKELLTYLKEAKGEYNLIIAGDGPGSKELQQQADEKDFVHFTGRLDHQELIKLMSMCDIVLNLSYQEGLSTTLLEAIYLQKQIIATDIPSNREVLQNYPNHTLLPKGAVPSDKDFEIPNTQVGKEDRQPIFPQERTLEGATSAYLSIYENLHG